jgi:hypothetical protein
MYDPVVGLLFIIQSLESSVAVHLISSIDGVVVVTVCSLIVALVALYIYS